MNLSTRLHDKQLNVTELQLEFESTVVLRVACLARYELCRA